MAFGQFERWLPYETLKTLRVERLLLQIGHSNCDQCGVSPTEVGICGRGIVQAFQVARQQVVFQKDVAFEELERAPDLTLSLRMEGKRRPALATISTHRRTRAQGGLHATVTAQRYCFERQNEIALPGECRSAGRSAGDFGRKARNIYQSSWALYPVAFPSFREWHYWGDTYRRPKLAGNQHGTRVFRRCCP